LIGISLHWHCNRMLLHDRTRIVALRNLSKTL